jgi:hypothetical protein
MLQLVRPLGRQLLPGLLSLREQRRRESQPVWMRRNHALEQQPVRVQGQVQVPQLVLLP